MKETMNYAEPVFGLALVYGRVNCTFMGEKRSMGRGIDEGR